MTAYRTEHLANGITVAFVDRSNRYFGDYHRVCVEVCLSVTGGEPGAARPQLVNCLERMAVPGAEVDTVRRQLVDDYWRHAGVYLAHPDYPARLAAQAARPGRRRPGSR